MDHAAIVGVGDRLRDAREGVDEAAERPASLGLAEAVGPRRGVDRVDDLAQGPAADLLHREPEAAIVELSLIVDGDDARVLEAGGDPRLGEEPRPHLGRGRVLEAQHLQREDPVEEAIAHAPHLAERPAADQLDPLVALGERRGAPPLVGRRCRRWRHGRLGEVDRRHDGIAHDRITITWGRCGPSRAGVAWRRTWAF